MQHRETIQTSFFVDLQDTSKKIEENDLKIEKNQKIFLKKKDQFYQKFLD